MYSKAISYSGLSLYRKCPAAWADAYINGNRGESGAAAQRGTILHEKIDSFFKTGDLAIIGNDKILRNWGSYFHNLLQYSPASELELGVTLDWLPADFNGEDANARGSIDLAYTLDEIRNIKDWKSGRVYESHEKQGEFYVALSRAYIEAPKYRVEMVYLDLKGHSIRWDYTIQQANDLQGELGEEIQALRLDTEYAPTPSNDACKWCPLSWRNGGKCHAAP